MAESAHFLTAFAVVREVGPGYAWVEPDRQGCGRCDEPGGCGGSGKGDLACAASRRVRVGNEIGAAVGQRVCIETSPGSVSRAASLGYILPLAGVLVGALLGQWLGAGELAAIIGAVGGGTVGWRVARRRPAGGIGTPRIVGLSPDQRSV